MRLLLAGIRDIEFIWLVFLNREIPAFHHDAVGAFDLGKRRTTFRREKQCNEANGDGNGDGHLGSPVQLRPPWSGCQESSGSV